MQELRVIGVENGALVVTSPDGERFRLPIDDVLQSRLRQHSSGPGEGHKLSPREIQDQIRSGMSAQDVAAVTGMAVDYIEKYEGPILAEREHVVTLALDVPVHTALETGPVAGGMSFGTVIRSRLSAISAINERWASWKEKGTGWVVKLSFTADQIDHDARWSFDPKRLTLSPLNGEATTLSQQGDVPPTLVPRLRAVAPNPEPDTTRFDSGAFDLNSHDIDATADSTRNDSAPVNRFAPRPQALQADSNQTADLLDALRRKRGEREAAPTAPEPEGPVAEIGFPTKTNGIRMVDVPMPEITIETAEVKEDDEAMRPTLPQPTVGKGRKRRASMPSWDDIVFGARSEDDPA